MSAPVARKRTRRISPDSIFGRNQLLIIVAAQPQPLPDDMQGIPHPIFGFVGALQSCIEYGYLEAAAKARPDWSFVLIGKEKPGVDLSALHAMPNVHFLGLKPNEQLPQYLAHFDACLNLFAKSDLSKDVSPLKFYEYLATGRPHRLDEAAGSDPPICAAHRDRRQPGGIHLRLRKIVL